MVRSISPARPVALFGAWLLGLAASPGANGDQPSNLQLIAAMPAGTESVLLYRYDLLTGEDSILRDDFVQAIDSLGHHYGDPDARSEPLPVIRRYVAMATPLVFVEGGSEFTAADGVGLGNYNGRSIWITERPLAKLVERFANRTDIKGDVRPLNLGAVQAFEFPLEVSISSGNRNSKPIPETCFIAFPNDHTLTIAETRSDLEAMLKGLGDQDPKIPAQWANLVTNLDVEAPIVVLRRYDPTNDRDYYSPVSPKQTGYRRADIESFGLVLPTVKHVAFRMKCNTKQVDRAAAYYQLDALSTDVFDWQLAPEAPGFTAEIRAKNEDVSQIALLLRLYCLFGPNVFI